jgi:hypothetical protein
VGKDFFDFSIIEVDPFTWLKAYRLNANFKKSLVIWQEISKEECDLYNNEDALPDSDQIGVPQTNPSELVNSDPFEDLEC